MVSLLVRSRARFSSQQHLTHQFITTFDNEVGVLSFAYALTEGYKHDSWSLQKLKVKEEPKSRTAKVSGIKKIDRDLMT